MNIQPDVLLVSRFSSFARGGSVVVMLAGCLVLLGWAFDITSLKTLLLGTLPMFANTAVAFLFAGASLRLALCDLADRRMYLLKQTCAVFVTLIGLLTLSQYLFGWNLGIDQLLFTFKEPLDTFTTSYPGRPAPNTALNFLLIGLGLLLLDRKTRHGRHPAQLLIIPAGVITLLGLLGYVYGAGELYQVLNMLSNY